MHKALSQLVRTECTIFISDECKSQIQKGSVLGYLCVYRVRVFIRFVTVCSLSVLVGSCSDISSWNMVDFHNHTNTKDFPIKNLNKEKKIRWRFKRMQAVEGLGTCWGFLHVHADVRTQTQINAHRYTTV